MTIKHVSFDAWNTLIEPNPDYAQERDSILLEFGLGLNFTQEVYRDVKKTICRDAEKNGLCSPNSEVYKRLLGAYGMDQTDWGQLQYKFERAFLKYPPLTKWETFAAIRDLTSADITISITSNTNPMSGRILRHIFLEVAPRVNWKFFLFSDEQEVAKPNPIMWQRMLAGAGVLDTSAVVHVGDHPVCDDASSMGIKSIIVNGPGDVPSAVKEILYDANSRKTCTEHSTLQSA